MRTLVAISLLLLPALSASGQSLLLQHPTVNRSQVVFAYADDLWSVSRTGGAAQRLTSGVGSFGGFQGILIDPKTGVLMGGSDPRKDGLAIGW